METWQVIIEPGAVSASFTALITGLLQRRTDRKHQRISIKLASGDKIDVPADIPPAELDGLIKARRPAFVGEDLGIAVK